MLGSTVVNKRRLPERFLTLEHSSWITSLALCHDGNAELLALAGNDGAVVVWALPRIEQLFSVRHPSPVCAVALSRDFLACGSLDAHAHVWSLPGGQALHRLGHQKAVGAVALGYQQQEEQSILVSGSDDRTACVWRLPSGEQLARVVLADSAGAVAAMGSLFVTGAEDGQVRVWRLSPSTPASSPQQPACDCLLDLQDSGGESGRWVSAVALTQDFVAAASSDKRLVVWRLPDGEQLWLFNSEDLILAVALSSSALVCGTQGGSTILWDLTHGERILSFLHGAHGRFISGSKEVGDTIKAEEEEEEDGPFPAMHAVALRGSLLVCAPGTASVVLSRLQQNLPD